MPTPRRAPGRRTRAAFVVGLIVVPLLAAACSGGEAKPPKGIPPAPERENLSFFYQQVRGPEDLKNLGQAQLVVMTQGSSTDAPNLIHSTGAKAFRYVQTYWFPEGQTYDGLDIENNSDWTFCKQDSEPVIGRTDARGDRWLYLDMNERAVHEHFAQKFAELKAEGWDGVFFDRGFASMAGFDVEEAGIWNAVSTCTSDPVAEGATSSDAYVGMTAEVANAGLELMLNYGVSPFDAKVPMRPDPRDNACVERKFAKCKRLDDAWDHITWVMDEAPAHPKDQLWNSDYAANKANEQDPEHGGKVMALITTGTLGGEQTKPAVYFEWARVKLFAIPLAVNTGDAGCKRVSTPCNRAALYPELVNIGFGKPMAAEPRSTACKSGSKIQCVWSRPYSYGMSVVNVSTRTVKNQELALDVDGCRYVKDVFSNRPLADGKCVEEVTLDLPAYSGRPLVYGTKPW